MTKKDTILKKIIEAVDYTAPTAEVYLFGSRARGTAKKMSDWDSMSLS